jgi:hypothetical protein
MSHSFQSVDFYYNGEIEKHIRRHFWGSTKAGGTFAPHIQTVAQLLALVNESECLAKRTQGRMRSCMVFRHPESIGQMGLGLRADHDPTRIQTEMRDGILIDYVEVDGLPSTQEFTLVCSWEKGRWQLITAYPGPAGEPFPHPKWDAQQNEQSAQFWERYILLKLKKD